MTAKKELRDMNEKECPNCGGLLDWKLVRNGFGSPSMNGLCPDCNIILYDREAPDVSRGREMVRSGELKRVGVLDEKITSLPCDVQIGILREMQGD